MKTKLFVSTLAAALTLAVIHQASAQTAGYIVGNPQATVRGGASASTNIIEGGGTGLATGTVSVKFAGSPFDTARKHYVKFTLAGNANTNGPLFLRYDTIGNSQRQDVSVWTLDQDFAGFTTSTQTWNTAQANDTASGSGFLTTGPATATYYQNFLSAAAANVLDTVHQLAGPWGHMIRSGNVIYMALSSTNDIGANGLRLGVNSVEIGYDTITSGTPPSLGAITNNLAAGGQLNVLHGFTVSTATNYFTVADSETAIASLTVTNTTSSEANFGTTNVFVEGSGATRSVYVTKPSPTTPSEIGRAHV